MENSRNEIKICPEFTALKYLTGENKVVIIPSPVILVKVKLYFNQYMEEIKLRNINSYTLISLQ
jgi:hypothetical protein